MKLSLRALLVVLPVAGLFTSLCAADRITQAVDSGRTVTLRGHAHQEALAGTDQGPVDPDKELHYLTLLLKPAPGLET
jgi:hypothetical protein